MQIHNTTSVPSSVVCYFASQMHPYLNNAELLDWCKEKGIHVTAYGGCFPVF